MPDNFFLKSINNLRSGHGGIYALRVRLVEINDRAATGSWLKILFVTGPKSGGGFVPLGDPYGLFLNIRKHGRLTR